MAGFASRLTPPADLNDDWKAARLAEPVQGEYERCHAAIGDQDPYVGPFTLGIHDALWAHFLIADFFYAEGEGVGGIGPKDLNLLHSALYRQHISYGGQPRWHDKLDIVATLLYGLIKNHPFHDANKRTAFLCCLYHLQKIGRCPKINKREFEDFTVSIAEDAFVKARRYRDLRRKGGGAEINYIAHFLKRNTRTIDKRNYIITYRELKAILNNFGFDLANPKNNFIDVVKCEQRKKFFGLSGRTETVQRRRAQIGFPGWTKQVNAGAIKTVRNSTQLTHENGYDSQTFFHGLDDMRSLLNSYQDALVRLADR